MLTLTLATPDDVTAISVLRSACAARLTADFGKGHWSGDVSERAVTSGMRDGRVYLMHDADGIVGTFKLQTRKPWAIDRSYFKTCKKPLYLTDMAVAPDYQRSGIGRRCLAEAARIAREWPADAIRLDAYDSIAGAGPFYAKCGFEEVGRATYRGTPLIYYEMIITPEEAP